MNVLYVDLEYDYGIKARGINAIGQDGFKKSFERLGHDVKTFYYDGFLKNKLSELQQALCEYADSVQPDLIFFCLYQDQITHETLAYLKGKYQTMNWFGDDQWRFDDFTSEYANDFTWCITTDQFSIEKYHKVGQKNVIYSQWAAIDGHAVNTTKEHHTYEYDVSFVGGYHPYRKWFIKKLSEDGICVTSFGHGWSNGALSSEKMNRIFATTKINLNISNSTSWNASYLCSSLRACVNTFTSKKTVSQMKARNFEIPFFGGFQLTDYVPTIEQYFYIGSEISCYSSVSDASRLIKYYLNNDIEREKIKELGQRRSVSEHGYIHRFEKIFREIQ